MDVERYDTIVIGGGQAGLATGYYLARAGRSFAILDASERIGDTWRRRWDSLRLFTPARYSHLPGMRLPMPGDRSPTKDQVADYLESYAERFSLPVRTGVRVDRLARTEDGYVVTAGGSTYVAREVVVATGANGSKRTPAFAAELDPSIVQIHAAEYKNPSQLRDGGVLVVGAGNSGAEISIEVARTHPAWLSGRHPGHVPVRIDTFLARHVVVRVVRFVGVHVLTLRTPMGRKMAKRLEHQGTLLVRVKPKDILAAGVVRVPRTVGTKGGAPLLEDGAVLDVANVIWCTGQRQDLSWIDLPIFDESGRPMHHRGVVTSEPGLYFVGLSFQYAEASDVLPGVSRDARYVVNRLLERPSMAREPVDAHA